MENKLKVVVTLLRFANARERAYQSVGALGLARSKSITRIRNVAGYYSTVPASKQLNAITQLKSELLSLLPPPMSRFKKQREEILHLIEITHA